MMKNKLLIYSLIIILGLSQAIVAQSENPSVKGMGSFEEYPVELFTGVPQVSVPIYSMPTRASDINIGLSLNYHPSSVSEFNKDLGNAGRGWTLNYGGVINRNIVGDPDEKTIWNPPHNNYNDFYFFNFLGYSGKFVIPPYATSGTIIENAGPKMEIGIEYDVASPSDVAAFKFYDNKGYIYIFAAADKINFPLSHSTPVINLSFHLSEIRDNNNKVLAIYNYSDHSAGGTFKKLSEITVPGYGKIEFNFMSGEKWGQFSDILVTDVNDNPVRKIIFDYSYSDDDLILNKVSIGDNSESEVQNYKMYYNSPPNMHGQSSTQIVGVDQWGYPNRTHTVCNSLPQIQKIADAEYCYNGVLEKMTLPTGGSVIYEYEANTYSFVSGHALNIDSFTHFNVPENYINFTKEIVTSKYFSPSDSSPLAYIIPQGSNELYLDFTGELYDSGLTDTEGQPIYKYPVFKIYKDGYEIYSTDGAGYPAGFACRGEVFGSTPGSYSFTMSPSGKTGSVTISSITLNPTIKKWHLGGGIRIKRIGYFSEDVPKNHYRNQLSTAIPSREINFGYNSFTDPTKSSGSLGVDNGSGNDVVRYKNITVTDTKTGGRTEYTYSNTIDFPEENSASDYRTGKLTNKRIYDSANSLQLESEYHYTDEVAYILEIPQKNAKFTTGWMGISKIINKQHFPSGVVLTQEEYFYNGYHNISRKETSTSRNLDKHILKYFYHSGNSVHSKNRTSVIETVEQYLNNDLLSVAKTIYSNSWNNPQNSAVVNVAYLPQQIQSAKQSNVPETKSRVNLYDEYGHPLEVQIENGIKKSTIWGYNNTLVIAEIDNIAYNSIPAALIADAQSASNGNDEALLLTKLAALRNAPQLSGTFVTTYTHKPLIGISSVTDPRGYRITYEYDVSNRLKLVKDQDGNILTENQYHNKSN